MKRIAHNAVMKYPEPEFPLSTAKHATKARIIQGTTLIRALSMEYPERKDHVR